MELLFFGRTGQGLHAGRTALDHGGQVVLFRLRPLPCRVQPRHLAPPWLGRMNRSPHRIANWFIADFQWLAERLQSWVMLRKASQISLVAAWLLGKCPRVLMIILNRAFTLSMALVV